MPTTPIAALAALSLLGSCASWKKFGYEGWGRERAQQPARVVEALAIAPGARVADLGAGGGYFTTRLADAVGPQGRVYAIDLDPDMLGLLREQAAGRANVEVIAATPDDPRLPVGGVDLLFSCNTYHHLSDRSAYFRRLAPSLRPGGRIALIDHDGRGWFGWLLFGHATPAEVMREEMAAAGYRLVQQHDFLARQSFLVFARAEGEPVRR